jgi:hypothetical protein
MVVSDSYNQALRQVFVPFTVTAEAGIDSARIIRWPSVVGTRYQVQYCDALADGVWQNLGSSILADQLSLAIPDPAPIARRFYRVLIVR